LKRTDEKLQNLQYAEGGISRKVEEHIVTTLLWLDMGSNPIPSKPQSDILPIAPQAWATPTERFYPKSLP
jgi:hypothetical protein